MSNYKIQMTNECQMRKGQIHKFWHLILGFGLTFGL
ncbi:MAG: hypothetical protein UT59_C0019G0005 [candidate division CPR2 bacterium GW2011_GWD1_39_7]|nr:MAG: hypothetical protein UT59_C0019G0005 [candidate division CPR2 bacterium GW2011_GWD1_39_7]